MPYRTSSEESLSHAALVVEAIGIETMTVEITPQVDAYFGAFPDAPQLRRGNKMARERMTILYDHSARWQGLVLGTSNKTELLLGYGTLHGDMASALNPLGDLYKTQVWALAEAMGVPAPIVTKQPSADLWHGQTDEHELGFGYREVDRLLYLMIDERYESGGAGGGRVREVVHRSCSVDGAGVPVQAPTARHRQGLDADDRSRFSLRARLGSLRAWGTMRAWCSRGRSTWSQRRSGTLPT